MHRAAEMDCGRLEEQVQQLLSIVRGVAEQSCACEMHSYLLEVEQGHDADCAKVRAAAVLSILGPSAMPTAPR